MQARQSRLINSTSSAAAAAAVHAIIRLAPTCLCRQEQAGGRYEARVGGGKVSAQEELTPVHCRQVALVD